MFNRFFSKAISFSIQFVSQEGSEEPCDMQRYVPEVGGLCSAIAAAGSVICGLKMGDGVEISTICKNNEPSRVEVVVRVRYRLRHMMRALFSFRWLRRRGPGENIMARPLRAMGIFGGRGFIQTKLWMGCVDEFMVAVNVHEDEMYVIKGNDETQVDSAEKLKINRDIARLMSVSAAHEGLCRFVSPLRCGAISGILIEAGGDSQPVMLNQEDARAFDFGSMKVNRIS